MDQDSSSEDKEENILKLYNQVRQSQKKRKRYKVPAEIAALKAEANNLYIFGDRSQAQSILENIIRNNPEYDEAYTLYALICSDLHQNEKAANFMMLAAKAKTASSSHSVDWANIAQLLKTQKNYEFASLYYGKALRKDPTNVGLMWQRVQCLEYLGQFKKCQKELDRIVSMLDSLQIQEGDFYCQILSKLAQCQQKFGQYEEARQNLVKINQIIDSNSEYKIQLCEVLEKQGKQQEIKEFLKDQKDWKNKPFKLVKFLIQTGHLNHEEVIQHYLKNDDLERLRGLLDVSHELQENEEIIAYLYKNKQTKPKYEEFNELVDLKCANLEFIKGNNQFYQNKQDQYQYYLFQQYKD